MRRYPTYPQRAAMLCCAYAQQARAMDDLYLVRFGDMDLEHVEEALSRTATTIAILRRQLSPYR